MIYVETLYKALFSFKSLQSIPHPISTGIRKYMLVLFIHSLICCGFFIVISAMEKHHEIDRGNEAKSEQNK